MFPLTKKLLAISGSPRKDGNADKMLSLAIRSAEEAGWQTNTIWLYEQIILIKGIFNDY